MQIRWRSQVSGSRSQNRLAGKGCYDLLSEAGHVPAQQRLNALREMGMLLDLRRKPDEVLAYDLASDTEPANEVRPSSESVAGRIHYAR